MKRLSLWLAVGFVLFSFSGGFAKEQVIPEDLASLPPGVIKYDKYIPGPDSVGKSLKNSSDYWIAVRFEVPIESVGFNLKGVEFKVNNELINTADTTAKLYLINDTCDLCNAPDFLNNRLDSVTVGVPLNRLQGKEFPSPHPFGLGDRFWIVLGPVPGGPDDSLLGQGWWAFSDRDTNGGPTPKLGSYVSFDNKNSWSQPDTGNFVIRARGDFSPSPKVVINEVMFNADPFSSDSARNHEWVELYNGGSFQTTNQWKLLNGTNSLPIPNINFDSSWYLVVHIGPTAQPNDADPVLKRINVYPSFTGEFLNNRQGGCALEVPVGQDTTIISYMGWNLENLSRDPDSTYGNQTLETLFPEAGIRRARRIRPSEGVGPLLTATAGISIGLDSSSDDSTEDLDIDSEGEKSVTFLGGPNAAGPTMGRRNLLPMTFDVSNPSPLPGGTADWTVMLYMAADYGDSMRSPDRWYYDILNQIERADSGGVGSVNVVVLYDTRRARLLDSSGVRNATLEGALLWDSTDIVRNFKVMPSDSNTGRDTTLAGFINRAKSSYPANNYVLALKGDGAGWEGLCGDADATDRLQMGELKSAFTRAGLATAKLDLLILDAPLMSQLEVATQVQDFAHRMVASPEMIGPADFDYARLVTDFRQGTDTSALVNSLKAILQERTAEDRSAVWSIVNLDNLDPLLVLVDDLSTNLKTGVEDLCTPAVGDTNNYQIKIRSQLIRLTLDHYGNQAGGMADFIDLKRFARLVSTIQDGGCAAGHKQKASDIANLLSIGGTVIAAVTGGGVELFNGYHLTTEKASGLSIYFPSARQRQTPILPKNFANNYFNTPGPYNNRSDHPFDSPGLMIEGGVYDTVRIYAADLTECYPHSGDTCGLYSADPNYPHPRVMNFDFVGRTGWDEFLIRYYKPVADAEILGGTDKKLNELITLNASGTSDADDDFQSLTFFWDTSATDNSTTDCSDYLLDDLDKDCNDNSIDDADKTGATDSMRFSQSGDHKIWLHVWDPTDSDKDVSLRRFQTDKDLVNLRIQFRGVQTYFEDLSIKGLYTNVLDSVGPPAGHPPHDGLDLDRLIDRVNFDTNNVLDFATFPTASPKPEVLWSTGSVPDSTFPERCRIALRRGLTSATLDIGAVIFGPKAGGSIDLTSRKYFDSLGFIFNSGTQSTSFIHPDTLGNSVFLFGQDSFPIRGGPKQLRTLMDTCGVFPILRTDSGKIVAAARVLVPRQHGIIFCTFGLEDLDGFDSILTRVFFMDKILSWLSSPTAPNSVRSCCANQIGDMNGVGGYTSADAVAMVSCVSSGTGNCNLCYADVTCDGSLTFADAVAELNKVFLGINTPPWCGP